VASPHGREGGEVRRRTAARQSRHHCRCKTGATAEAEAAVAAAATGADNVGGASVLEGANPVALGAACEGRWAVRLGPQHGAPAHISSASDCTLLSSSAA